MTTEIKKTPGPLSPTARNMIIGIITTVLVSGTIYLLGFNKKDPITKLERQTATTAAWKTYVTIENIYAKNTTLIMRDSKQFSSVKELYAEIMKESDQFMASLQGLITNENIDKDMVAVLKRRASNEKTLNPRVEKFYMNMDRLVERGVEEDWTEKQLQDSILAIQKVFAEQNKGAMDRALAEIESLAKTLSKRYNETFNVDDFFVIQIYKYKKDMLALLADEKPDSSLTENITKDYFVGKWAVINGANITYSSDDTWSLFLPTDSTEGGGTWQLKAGQLIMNVDKHSKMPGKYVWTYNLSGITDTSFSMIYAEEPYNFLRLVRK